MNRTLQTSITVSLLLLLALLSSGCRSVPIVAQCPKPPSLPASVVRTDSDNDQIAKMEEILNSADGTNIAPVLLRYARDAEELRLALRACQAYGREIDRLGKSQ